MRRETQNLVLLLIGVSMVMVTFTGAYTRYVKPAMLPWLIISAGVLIALALAAMVRDIRGGDAAGPDPHHGEHDRVVWLLVLPIVMLLFIVPPALSSQGAAPVSVAASTAEPFPPLPPGHAPAVAVPNVLMRIAAGPAGGLDGRRITVTGFTMTDGGHVDLAKIVIICCAADAQLARLHLAGPAAGAAAALPDTTWIEVQGIVPPGQTYRGTRKIALLHGHNAEGRLRGVMDELGFERGRLRVARELVGLSQAQLAAQVGVSPAAISQFESGSARPSSDSLGQLADTLRVPVDFFFQPITETHEGFFRSLRRTAVSDRRRARSVAHVAHDLASAAAASSQFPESAVPYKPPSGLNADRQEIEDIAQEVRDAWQVPDGPIANMVSLLENHGVAVIRLPLDSAAVDAFSLPFSDHPIVVLGSDKNDRARSRFDCAHELGHIVMHGESIWGVKEVETQAHQFAAAFLMPADQIGDELPTTIDWQRFLLLKERWQTSIAALLMRAKTLGRMSDATYLSAIKAASARGWRRREPVSLGSPEQPTLLLNFLESQGSHVRSQLPAAVIDSIVAASSVA